ncbi:MAG: hypothetical protein KDI46_06220 [Alphaproteobacteria bacterium]|nr:hypothetical protein [Alphaproteobacteria bacterium]
MPTANNNDIVIKIHGAAYTLFYCNFPQDLLEITLSKMPESETMSKKISADKIINDKRFSKSLERTLRGYSDRFGEAGGEQYKKFMHERYITEKRAGHPYTYFLSRYFCDRALRICAGQRLRPKENFEKMARVFRRASRASRMGEIQIPQRADIEALADKHIQALFEEMNKRQPVTHSSGSKLTSRCRSRGRSHPANPQHRPCR